MRWRSRPCKQERIAEWHKWFAWYPIRMNGRAIWMEYVERKCTYWYSDGERYGDLLYREIEEQED